jgi:hypothetical protein
MPLLQKSDLQFEYSWTAIPPDDPRVTGKPDSTLLNRGEGYEVLAFINSFAVTNDWKQKASGLKTERLIKKHLPSDTRSHANVRKWLVDNWKKYD